MLVAMHFCLFDRSIRVTATLEYPSQPSKTEAWSIFLIFTVLLLHNYYIAKLYGHHVPVNKL